MGTTLQKAKLEIEDPGGSTSQLDCWFNPQTYTIARRNEWNLDAGVGRNLPHAPQFVRGAGATFSLELLFDAGLPFGDVGEGVRPATDQLLMLMEAKEESNKPPPTVQFTWGAVRSFRAVCTELAINFLMFSGDGTPTRARATLTLSQIEKDARTGTGSPAAKQNPTTSAHRHAGSHVVRDGDSLQSIAFAFYRDATRWRDIATENDIDDPVRVPSGALLRIPLATS
jgi:Contractile injection system tube protein/LysM domain